MASFESFIGIIIFVIAMIVKFAAQSKKRNNSEEGGSDIPLLGKLKELLQEAGDFGNLNTEKSHRRKKRDRPTPPKLPQKEEEHTHTVARSEAPKGLKDQKVIRSKRVQTLRKAVIWSEILGKPKGLQE